MKQISIWKTLAESFKILFKHYQIFVPIIFGILFGLIIAPLYLKLIFSTVLGGLSLGTFFLFILFYLVMIIFSLIVYSWTFNLIKQAVKTKKINLAEALKSSPKLAWKIFKTSLIILVFMIFAGLVIGLLYLILGIIAGLLPPVGVLLMVLLTAILIIIFMVVYFALFLLIPVITLENLGAWGSLKLTYQYFMKRKILTIKIGGLSLLLLFISLFISYIPLMVFTLIMGAESLSFFILEHWAIYSVLSALLSIPIIIVLIGIFMFYTRMYIQNK